MMRLPTGLPIFNPEKSPWLDRWDFLVLVVLLEVTFATPYELAFLDVSINATFFFNRVIDGIFFLDMLIRFCVAIPNPERHGSWIKDRGKIARSYAGGWLVPDLMSLIPVDILYVVIDDDLGGVNLKAIRLARTVRLLRVTQGLRLLQRWRASIGLRNWLVSIVGLLYVLSVCCHWVACLWGGIAWGAEPPNWLSALISAKGNSFSYDTEFNVYCVALYWSIMTITGVGYGDINAQTDLEYKVALVCMTMMSISWAIVLGQVCAIISTFSLHEVRYKRTMDDLNGMLSDCGVASGIRRNIRVYFMESKELIRVETQKLILEQMSPKLQAEVLNAIHRSWTEKVRFLQKVSDEALVATVHKVRSMLFAPDEVIVASTTLYVVRRGIASLAGKVKVKGSFWGEDMVLENPVLRRKDPTRALCFLEVNALACADLMRVAEAHVHLMQQIKNYKRTLAVSRGMVILSRVVKKLRISGLLDLDMAPTPGQVLKLSGAALSGDVDGDLATNPMQEIKLRQLLKEAADHDRALKLEQEGLLTLELESNPERRRTRPQESTLLQAVRAEAFELLTSYLEEVETAWLGPARRQVSRGDLPTRSRSPLSSRTLTLTNSRSPVNSRSPRQSRSPSSRTRPDKQVVDIVAQATTGRVVV